jgi:hypothetical protein
MKEFNYGELPPDVREWYDSRPACVQRRILKYPPGEKYLMISTGQVCRLFAYTTDKEDTICEECQVLILQHDNRGALLIERRVFGIGFDDLGPVPEGYAPPGDRPLEEMEPAFRERLEEVIKEKGPES